MSQSRRRLQRLLAIRRIGEEVARQRLKSALDSLAEAQTVLSQERQVIASAGEAALSALDACDRSERLFAEAEAEVAGWNLARLASVLESRRAEIPLARAAFLDRRREAEQIEHFIQQSNIHEQLREDRNAQTAADDWFLAQLARKRK